MKKKGGAIFTFEIHDGKDQEVDVTYFFAERDAREGRFGEIILKLRSDIPLTRGERDVLVDILEGKVKRPKNRPKVENYELQSDVFRTVAKHRMAGKKPKAAISLAAEHHRVSESTVRRLLAEAKGPRRRPTIADLVDEFRRTGRLPRS